MRRVGRSAAVFATLLLSGASALEAQSFETRWEGIIDLDRRCEEVVSAGSAVQTALPDGSPVPIEKDRIMADAHDVGMRATEQVLAARLDLPSVESGWFTFAARLRSSCDAATFTPVYPAMDADDAAYTVSGRPDSIDVNLRAGWLYANVSRLGDGAHATVTVGGRSFPVRPRSPTEIGVGVGPADTVIVVRRGSVTLGTGGNSLVIGAGQEWRASRGGVLESAPEDALRSIDRIGIEEWMGWPSRAWRAFRERPVWQQAVAGGLVGWGAFELVRALTSDSSGRDVDVRIRFP